MRVRPGAGRGQPDLLEQLADPALHLGVGHLRLVQPDRLGDLPADPAYGVERVQGALEHDRGPGPAQRPQVAPAHRQHVLVVDAAPGRSPSPTPAGAAGWCWPGSTCRSRTRRRRRRTSPRSTRQVDAAYGGQVAAAGAVGDREVLDLQQRAHAPPPPAIGVGVGSLRSRGLSTSSSACPTSVKREHDQHHAHARRDEEPPRARSSSRRRCRRRRACCPTTPGSGRRGRGSSASSRSGSRPRRVSVVFANTIGITLGSTCLRIRCAVPGAERARALEVGPLLDRQRLAADQQRRARPGRHADHEHDVEQRPAEHAWPARSPAAGTG